MPKNIKNKVTAKGFEIAILTQNQNDFVSLTDIAKYKNPDEPRIIIANWMSSYSTVDFLATWEELNNPNFNRMEFQTVRSERGRFVMTPKQWIEKMNAIGIKSSAGRYGGTYAHVDIALEFASWISPEFKLYVIKEYQRLKQSESYQNQIEWNVNRELAKVNYTIHTDAIKSHLIPEKLSKYQISTIYASEGDLLNVALFGMTAKEFKTKNPDKKGNQRDNATIEQNIIMASLESSNALMIQQGLSQSERLTTLRQLAVTQLESVLKSRATKEIKRLAGNKGEEETNE
ncbi:KilA-N domain-containing protein [Streptococcus macedonicus]